MSNENSPSVKEEQLHLCSKRWPNCSSLVEIKKVVTLTAESLVAIFSRESLSISNPHRR
jgi:hypothetical protein